jgi:hypothetical protein
MAKEKDRPEDDWDLEKHRRFRAVVREIEERLTGFEEKVRRRPQVLPRHEKEG